MKKTTLITVLSTLTIIVALVSSLFLEDDIGSRMVNVVTVITGIIGAIALFIQFKKDKLVNSANFLLTYSKSFYDEYDLFDIFSELNKHNTNPEYQIDIKKYQPKIVAYLEWIEALASLI